MVVGSLELYASTSVIQGGRSLKKSGAGISLWEALSVSPKWSIPCLETVEALEKKGAARDSEGLVCCERFVGASWRVLWGIRVFLFRGHPFGDGFKARPQENLQLIGPPILRQTHVRSVGTKVRSVGTKAQLLQQGKWESKSVYGKTGPTWRNGTRVWLEYEKTIQEEQQPRNQRNEGTKESTSQGSNKSRKKGRKEGRKQVTHRTPLSYVSRSTSSIGAPQKVFTLVAHTKQPPRFRGTLNKNHTRTLHLLKSPGRNNHLSSSDRFPSKPGKIRIFFTKRKIQSDTVPFRETHPQKFGNVTVPQAHALFRELIQDLLHRAGLRKALATTVAVYLGRTSVAINKSLHTHQPLTTSHQPISI